MRGPQRAPILRALGWRSQVARRRLPSHEFAQDLLGAGALAGVILLGDGARLAAEFQAKEPVLEAVEAVLHFALDGRHVNGRYRGRDRCDGGNRGSRSGRSNRIIDISAMLVTCKQQYRVQNSIIPANSTRTFVP